MLALASATAAAALALWGPLGLEIQLRSPQAQARPLAKPWWSEAESARAPGGPESFADLAERLSPAVVNIKVKKKAEPDPFEEFFGGPRGPGRSPWPRRPVEAGGSGFVISPDGYVVTNNHVVEKSEGVTVKLRDGRELPAKIVGLDPKTDVALIKVEADNLPTAPLGDSEALRVGEWVMAIGNPLGLEHSVTVGILSAKGRKGIGGEAIVGQYDDFLQTDASINPGNSGGPLIDMSGRVIGINTAIANPLGGGQGIGFAIPIAMAKEILPQLREEGRVTRGWLGVSIQKITPELAKTFGLEEPRGALVNQVFDNTPAQRAKLQVGDVILEFNGKRIQDVDDLPRIVASTAPGSAVDVMVLRDGKSRKLSAVLDQMEDEPQVAQTLPGDSPSSRWGFEVEPLTRELAARLGVNAESGVVVSGVEPDSPAASSGLRPGDVILEANRQKITSPAQLSKALEKEEAHATLLIQRGEQTIYLAIPRE
jgi:serine protease Do